MLLLLIGLSSSISASWAQDSDNSQYPERPEEQLPASTDQKPHGDIMLVSATIVGFGGFGGLLAARFRGNDINKQTARILIIYGAIFCKMSLHLVVILFASKRVLTLSTYEPIIIATIFLVGVIVTCFGVIAVLQKNYDDTHAYVKHASASKRQEAANEIKRSPL